MKHLFLVIMLAVMGCSDGDSSNSSGTGCTDWCPDSDVTGTTDEGTTDEVQQPAEDTGGGEPEVQDNAWNCPADEVEFKSINVGEVSLNVACRGSGPTIVFLHGFPEFWYGWKWVMDELAGEFRLVVPDQRGYNLSDKPAELEAYHITKLVGDIVGLIDALDTGKVVLVAHDWGGVVAWALGAAYPELLDKLVILNAPHPQVFARELAENPEQQAASTYITWFMNEGFEDTLAANDFAFLVGTVFNDSFTEQDKAAYKAAWGQPGALKAGLNWYRANFADGTPSTGEVIIDKVPTLVLWGMKDTALLPGNLVGLDEYVTDLTIQKFEDATHWIAHEEAAGVAQAIREFVNPSE